MDPRPLTVVELHSIKVNHELLMFSRLGPHAAAMTAGCGLCIRRYIRIHVQPAAPIRVRRQAELNSAKPLSRG